MDDIIAVELTSLFICKILTKNILRFLFWFVIQGGQIILI